LALPTLTIIAILRARRGVAIGLFVLCIAALGLPHIGSPTVEGMIDASFATNIDDPYRRLAIHLHELASDSQEGKLKTAIDMMYTDVATMRRSLFTNDFARSTDRIVEATTGDAPRTSLSR
jgi:hypothetical protein